MERTFADYLTQAPVFVRRLDGEITYWTVGAEELYGYSPDEAVGRISHELLKTEFPAPQKEVEQALLTHGDWRGRLRHVGKDGRAIWTESLWRLRARERGGVVVEQNTDISERVEAERQRDLVAAELDHRVKNTLAVVQALARLSFPGGDAQQLDRFDDRLVALARAHDLLQQANWEGAALDAVLDAVIDGFRLDQRVTCTGPPVQVATGAAIAFFLAFHELATNAIKHGALRDEDGRVEVRWSAENNGIVHVIWRETGARTVTAPAAEGPGTRLVRAALAAELRAPVGIRYEPQGLVCEFDGRTRPAALAEESQVEPA